LPPEKTEGFLVSSKSANVQVNTFIKASQRWVLIRMVCAVLDEGLSLYEWFARVVRTIRNNVSPDVRLNAT